MNDFVLDASITLCWALADERNLVADEAQRLLHLGEGYVPTLWWFEIRNSLIVNERRNRITKAETVRLLTNLHMMDIVIDNAPDEGRILVLARTHGLKVYDAAYLELAIRLSTPLATLDNALRQAATQEGVALVGVTH